MQRLAFEFPNWAADGIEKDLENCETTFKISGGMEVGLRNKVARARPRSRVA